MIDFKGKMVMFSGFDDQKLQNRLESLGATFGGNINSTNILITREHIDMQNFFSSKVKIAMMNRICIVDRDFVKNKLN